MIFDVGMPVLPCFYEIVELFFRTGSFIDGRFVIGSVSQVSINAVVQPAKSRDLQNLPEGSQVNGAKVFYTQTQIETVDDKNSTLENYILHENRLYKITSLSPWQSYGYYKSIGTLTDKDVGDL
jgi:hypothetical protein